MRKIINEDIKEMIHEQIRTQDDWKEYITNLIQKSPKAAIRALMVVYNNQTPIEKITKRILSSNGLGFDAIDVKPLSRIAEQIKRNQDSLTEYQLNVLRNRLPKYWKQIMIVSKANLEDEKELPIVKEKTRVENELMLRKQEQLMRQRHLLEERNAIENGSLHLEQMQLDLFPEGEYHNNMIPNFREVDPDGKL